MLLAAVALRRLLPLLRLLARRRLLQPPTRGLRKVAAGGRRQAAGEVNKPLEACRSNA